MTEKETEPKRRRPGAGKGKGKETKKRKRTEEDEDEEDEDEDDEYDAKSAEREWRGWVTRQLMKMDKEAEKERRKTKITQQWMRETKARATEGMRMQRGETTAKRETMRSMKKEMRRLAENAEED